MVAFSKLPVMISYEDIVDKRYENGKIYLIKCKNDDNLIYVGSTIKKLEMRFSHHKIDKNISLHKYVKNWDDWYIELYENFPCKNRYLLEIREDEIIKKIATINKKKSFRNPDEYKKERIEYLRVYNERQGEHVKAKKKEWYELNRDEINKRRKEKYELNRDEINKRRKEKYELNRYDRLEKERERYALNRDDRLEKERERYALNRDKINKRRRELRKLKKQNV
jgi:hypothetical protein